MAADCGFKTNEEIAVCVAAARDILDVARPWIELILGVAGIGTLALVSLLVWMLKRLKNDVEKRQSQTSLLQNDLVEAKSARDDAFSRLRTAEKMVGRASRASALADAG